MDMNKHPDTLPPECVTVLDGIELTGPTYLVGTSYEDQMLTVDFIDEATGQLLSRELWTVLSQ